MVFPTGQNSPPPGGQEGIEGARAGGGQALGQLLEAFRGYLLLVANQDLPRDLHTKVGPSDLVQETLLRACRHFERFQGRTEAELRAWLRRILLNHLANVRQQYCGTGKRHVGREVPLALAPAAEMASQADSPSSAASAQERSAALQRALAQLPERYVQVISWRSSERLSFEEVGRRLGCSAEAARKLWARGIEKLAATLELPDESRG